MEISKNVFNAPVTIHLQVLKNAAAFLRRFTSPYLNKPLRQGRVFKRVAIDPNQSQISLSGIRSELYLLTYYLPK